MSAGDDEARLRAALAEAHRRDAEVTPSFARVWGATRGPRALGPFTRWAVLSASLVVVVALGIWLVQRTGPPPASLPTGTHWIAPTDFLLDTPDLVTLRTIPPLGPATDRLPSPPTDRRRVPQ